MAEPKQSLGDKIGKEDLALARQTVAGIFDAGDSLSCGMFWVDFASGKHGVFFPKESITELAALKGAGKTTICLETIAYNQMLAEQNGTKFRVLYMDFEHNLIKQQDMARAIGVDTGDDCFFYRQPKMLESGMQFVIECLRPHTRKKWLKIDEPLDLIVIDTLAAARPKEEVDNKVGGTNKPGYRGKKWSEIFRNIQADLGADCPTAVVAINHLQQIIDMTGWAKGPPKYDSPASNALKLYAAQRYFLFEKEHSTISRQVFNEFTYETAAEPYAMFIEILCNKSKVAPPFKRTSYYLVPGRGICDVVTLFNVAERKKEAEKVSPFYSSSNNAQFGVPLTAGDGKDACPNTVMGRVNFMEHLYNNEEDRTRLASHVNSLWASQIEKHNLMRERIERLQAESRTIDEGTVELDEEELLATESEEEGAPKVGEDL